MGICQQPQSDRGSHWLHAGWLLSDMSFQFRGIGSFFDRGYGQVLSLNPVLCKNSFTLPILGDKVASATLAPVLSVGTNKSGQALRTLILNHGKPKWLFRRIHFLVYSDRKPSRNSSDTHLFDGCCHKLLPFHAED